jgi:aldehyde dehydrogenase (NAD+)
MESSKMALDKLLGLLDLQLPQAAAEGLLVNSPIDGANLGLLKIASSEKARAQIDDSFAAFQAWRLVPMPKRGELVRRFGESLREHKEILAQIITLECGKILEEARGEVQEMIDICDFAVGLSRSISGLTLPSERSLHVMQESWHPLGVVLVISAFNFPAAVWAWNAAIAIVCGDSVLWKPSEKTPIVALACQKLWEKTVAHCDDISVPVGLCSVVLGDSKIGALLVEDRRVALVSATGSTSMGRQVAKSVAARIGRSLLELGGNNAVIITESADLSVALPSVVFGAVGAAGQRCTTSRRLLVAKSRYEEVLSALQNAYKSVWSKIGDPRLAENLVGPLIDRKSYESMQQALQIAKLDGGKIFGGERVNIGLDGYYVQPAFVALGKQTKIVMEETFAPILYVLPYENLEEAISLQNAVLQGLSASIFTKDLREAEYFRAHCDCGIANVNIGTSGAEIGGAFGGEKETGGGRESGSDAWKNYMRRQTSTLYYGENPPTLAQGIVFPL